jgi:replicative DNA helicase
MIFDQKLEHHIIAGLLKRPNEYLTIQSFFSEQDFYTGKKNDSILCKTVFGLIRQAVEKGEGDTVDATIIAQRAESLGINFDEEIPVGQFIVSLSLRNIEEGAVYKAALELKKLSARRTIQASLERAVEKLEKADRSASIVDLQDIVDKEVNSQINLFDGTDDAPVNIYDDMEAVVESTGMEQKEEVFGKFSLVNKIYGSLHEPGNITTIIARSAGGKTTLALDECCYINDKYEIPVLHFDNGEMSKEELQFRRISSMSGVPHYLIKKGLWRNNPETCAKVRAAIKRIKELGSKFYYHCMAGMSADEMIAVAKKFYYSKVGRGNRMIISFDYIKPPEQNVNGSPEWQVLGELVNRLKKFIQKEILFEGKPMISLFTSAQANRSGVVTNKSKDKIIDDESIISGADRIIHYSSHVFILRKKVMEEILEEGPEFGTHKLIRVKARHLGEDIAGDLEPVKDGDQLRQNFICLSFENFSIRECGDLRNIIAKRGYTLEKSHSNEPTSF